MKFNFLKSFFIGLAVATVAPSFASAQQQKTCVDLKNPTEDIFNFTDGKIEIRVYPGDFSATRGDDYYNHERFLSENVSRITKNTRKVGTKITDEKNISFKGKLSRELVEQLYNSTYVRTVNGNVANYTPPALNPFINYTVTASPRITKLNTQAHYSFDYTVYKSTSNYSGTAATATTLRICEQLEILGRMNKDQNCNFISPNPLKSVNQNPLSGKNDASTAISGGWDTKYKSYDLLFCGS